jgi:hypothetical protein
MNSFSRISALIILTFQLISVPGCGFYPINRTWHTKKVDNDRPSGLLIRVVIPPSAEAIMKRSQSRYGRLKAINLEQVILYSGEDIPIMLSDIRTLKFGGEIKLISTGNVVLRGKQVQEFSRQVIWTEPLSSIQIKDASSGFAEVTLTSISDRLKRKGILAVSKKSDYVVQEIHFLSNQRISIKASVY